MDEENVRFVEDTVLSNINTTFPRFALSMQICRVQIKDVSLVTGEDI